MADLDLHKIGWDLLIKELKNKKFSFSQIKTKGRRKYIECNNKIIFVKTKKGNRWPAIKGITSNEIYVFIDFPCLFKLISKDYNGVIINGNLNEEIKKAFETNGIILSDNTTISEIKKNKRWIITDINNEYSIEKIEKNIKIYDFQNKRPDFYILNVEDYENIRKKRCSEVGMKNRHKDKNNTLISDNEIIKATGKSYKGFSVDCSDVLDYLEKWEKL